MADRLLRPERLRELLANLLGDSSAALRIERTHTDDAIQNMLGFIEQGILSSRGSPTGVPGAPILNRKPCSTSASYPLPTGA